MDSSVYLQPGFILNYQAYRESSLLLEVFTQDYGIISIIARGVRKEKSKTAGLLQPFLLLSLSYLNKQELKALTHVELTHSYSLQRLSMYCGFYVNELVQKFLHKHDPNPELFMRYQRCLEELTASPNLEQILRYFELDLLQEAGFGMELDQDCHTQTQVLNDLRYNFLREHGMSPALNGLVSGHTLKILASQGKLDEIALPEAKALLRHILDVYLDGKPLKSRGVLRDMLKYL